MLLEMPRIHPYLKGLAETRARADDEHARAAALLQNATSDLALLQERLERQGDRLKKAIVSLARKAEAASTAREACDQLIRKFNQQLDPAQIAPVQELQGRYGKWGVLGQMVRGIIEDAYPESISTSTVAYILQAMLGLEFVTARQRCQWTKNTVKNRLRHFTRTGVIERLHDPRVQTSKLGSWRGIPPSARTKGLAALAAEAGLPLTHAADENDLIALAVLEEDDLPR